MKAIDLKGLMNQYFRDIERKISSDCLENICKIHHKEKTCRFISLTPGGFYCVKDTPVAAVLNEKVKNREMVAQGDNCEGFKKINKSE